MSEESINKMTINNYINEVINTLDKYTKNDKINFIIYNIAVNKEDSHIIEYIDKELEKRDFNFTKLFYKNFYQKSFKKDCDKLQLYSDSLEYALREVKNE